MNPVSEYLKKYPVTSPMGALYVLELTMSAYFGYRATQSDFKYNALLSATWGLAATSMLAREKII